MTEPYLSKFLNSPLPLFLSLVSHLICMMPHLQNKPSMILHKKLQITHHKPCEKTIAPLILSFDIKLPHNYFQLAILQYYPV
jgi:hypothetical protein